MTERHEVPGREAATFDVVGAHDGHAVADGVDQDDGDAAVEDALQGVGRRRHRHDEQAVGAVAPGQGGEELVAVDGLLDVEQHEVVAAAVEGGGRRPAGARPREAWVKNGTTTPRVWQRPRERPWASGLGR